ncbi:MAG: dehydrogenase maturation factor [Methanofollis sp.]|nr:dehydrogenase maturation factor [Methanofollis sp.]
MKIVICGKGGCGKSTVTSLLARSFVKNGFSVLVIDTDESNFGLHRQLGLDLPPDFMGYFGGKKAVGERMVRAAPNRGAVSFFDKPWTFADLPQAYLSGGDGVKLIAIGKIHEAGEGCACAMGMLAKQFIGNMRTNGNEVILTDTEAGIEHFGRGIEEHADAVLMVVDPSCESLKLAEKVAELSGSLGKPVYFVLNKVDGSNERYLRNTLGARHPVAAAIPADPSLALAGLRGDPVAGESAAVEDLSRVLRNSLAA